MPNMVSALNQIAFSLLLPAPLLIALSVLCAAITALAFWRRSRGAVWRGVGFAVLLLWLAGPHFVREQRQDLPDIALLVLDDTASMQIADRAGLREQARAAIERQAGTLPGLEWRTVTVPETGHDGTRLFAAIDRALADIPRSRLAGIVAVTDGQVADIPATPPSAPLNVLLPAAGEQIDRRLRILEAPGYGLVGQNVTVKLVVEDLGAPPASTGGGQAVLTIHRDGEPARTETVPVGQEVAITLPVPRAGPSVVDLQVAALTGEVSTLNNRAVLSINGVRDRLRVLLVSGQPHVGERTWRRLLKSDPAVDLVHFTILRLPEKDDMTPLTELSLIAFPVRELFQVKLHEFDLVIMDRFQDRGLLPTAYLQNIADYVRDGGALLMSVGPEFAGADSLANGPLGSVLPAGPGALVNAPFRPALTALGTRHPVTENLPGSKPGAPPWGEWFRRITPADPHGQALMQGPDGQPLLLLDRVGKGRVALLLSDQIWLWSRGYEGGGPQAELLRRLAHWLMGEPELEEQALDARIADGQLIVERRSTEDRPPPPVTITDPDGHAQTLALQPAGPGRAGLRLPAATPGVWQIADGSHVTYAAATEANPAEYADLRVTATKLDAIARASGGGTHWLLPDGVPQLDRVEPGRDASGTGWIGLRRNHDGRVTGIDSLKLLPGWAALPMVLALLLAAWWREGR